MSPSALGPVAADPGRTNDRLSASYLIALAARTVRAVGELWRVAARHKNKRLATLSIDTAVRFRSAADRAAFTRDFPTRSRRWWRASTTKRLRVVVVTD